MSAALQLELVGIPAPSTFEIARAAAWRAATRAASRARAVARAAAEAIRRAGRVWHQLELKLVARVARDLSEGWRVALEFARKFKAKIEKYASRWHLAVSEFLSALQLDICERWAAGKELNLATIFGHARDLIRAPLVKSAKQKGKPTSKVMSLTREDGSDEEFEGGDDPADLAVAAEDGPAEEVLAPTEIGISERTARRRRAELRRALGITRGVRAACGRTNGLAYSSHWRDSKLGGWWQPQPQDGPAFIGFGRREAKEAAV